MRLFHNAFPAVFLLLPIPFVVAQPATAPTRREQLATGDQPVPADRGWVDEVKNPVKWFKWGSDLRARVEYVSPLFNLNDSAPNHEYEVARYRIRLWGAISPVENLDFNARLTWEGKHFWKPDSQPEWVWPDTFVDTLDVKFSKLFKTTSSLTVGRQDVLNLGDGWLLFEGTPLDGSRTLFFDAVRFTLADVLPRKTTLDLLYIDDFADPDTFIPSLGTDDTPLIEQDEQGAVAWLSNRAIEKTALDGYFMYKNDTRVLANGDNSNLYTFGLRAARELDAHWRVRAEGAYQFGHRLNPVVYPDATSGEVSAFGGLARATYAFNDENKNQLKLTCEYLSGDDPDTAGNEAMDPLWGRWPQWSDLWSYLDAGETRIAETTNLQRIALGWQMNPTKKLELCADYSLLFANQNTYAGRTGFSSTGNFRGQLIDATLRYTFSRFVSGNLIGEYLFPGDYYQTPSGDDGMYFRAELLMTF